MNHSPMTRAFSQPSFSRSQSWASQARSDTTVEDSEPERQERRLKAKTTRRVKSKKTPVVGAARRSEDVIELTDSSPSRPSTPAPRLLNAQPAPLAIIDVSDDNESSTRHDPPGTRPLEDDSDHVAINGLGIEISGDGTLEDESLPSIRRVLGLPKAREQKVVQVPGSVLSVRPLAGPALLPMSACTCPESSEDESGSAGSKLKLGHFAYAAPNPLRRTASKTPSPVERGSQTSDVISNAAKPSPTHRFAEDFTDAQLSRLLKCVSCQLAWTARKTVKEKMKHIQSCAKRNRLTDETVRILLRTELAKLPPVASSSKSKSPAEPPAPSVPETLLEETLKDKRRKRSGPRLQVLEPTVKEVSETRSDILDKARLLLQNVPNVVPAGYSAARQLAEGSIGSADRESAMPPPTQAFAESSVAVRAGDHPAMGAADTTQAFGSSRLDVARIQEGIINAGAAIAGESDLSPLTQVFTKSALASAMADVDPADGMPPATQVFAPSKLTNGGPFTRKVAPANDDPMDQPISLHDSSEDDLDLSKSSPASRSIIEIPSSPSSNAKRPLKLPTERNPRAAATDPAVQSLRSPSPPPQSPSPAGNEPGSPEYYDGPEFHVQNEYEYLWNEWDHERNMWDEYDGGGDAFLHYDPDADVDAGSLVGLGSPNVPLSPASPPRRRLAAIPEDGAPVAGPSRLRGGPEPPVEAVAKKKRGRPRKVTTDESDAEPGAVSGKDISQEELNAKLKGAVLKDEVLHLRILRYELAADAGITEKRTKLKGKVRTFLDQKAIHFYGADATKSRTKRTRHP